MIRKSGQVRANSLKFPGCSTGPMYMGNIIGGLCPASKRLLAMIMMRKWWVQLSGSLPSRVSLFLRLSIVHIIDTNAFMSIVINDCRRP